MFNTFMGGQVDAKSPEAKYLRLVERFKSTLEENLRMVGSLGQDQQPHHKAVAEKLDKLANQVTEIEKANLDMVKRMPNCGTIAKKMGFYGKNSIFLKLTQALRNEIHALGKTIQKNGQTFGKGKGRGMDVDQMVNRLGELSYAIFDGNPHRDHKEQNRDRPPMLGNQASGNQASSSKPRLNRR